MEAQPPSKPYLHRKPHSGNAITLPIIAPAAYNICHFITLNAIVSHSGVTRRLGQKQ